VISLLASGVGFPRSDVAIGVAVAWLAVRAVVTWRR
jgi:hypothetical protein